MNTKPDAPVKASSPQYCLHHNEEKAVPSRSTYQPGQLDKYLADTHKNDGKRSPAHGPHTTERRSKHDHHRHNRAQGDMSTARSSRGQDDAAGALPVKMKPRTGADTKSRCEYLRNDLVAQAQANKRDVDMEENETVAHHPDTALYPEEVAASGNQTWNVDTNPIKERRSFSSNPDDSCYAQTSALGIAAMASISMSHSIEMTRAYKTHGLNCIEEEHPNMRVGATVVPGWSPSRCTSDHSASTTSVMNDEDSLLPPAMGNEQPLQAMLVADRVTRTNEDDDIEAQVQARMRSEAEGIADMVQRRILQNTPTAVVHPREAPKSEDNEAGKRRKKICIIAGVLVIAAAIGVALGITLPKSPTPTSTLTPTPTLSPSDPYVSPPDRTELFKDALVAISGERLDDEDSPQYRALDWIANKDPAKTSVGVTNPEIIEQRYAAAVLYFALGGDNWLEKYNFLSEDPICAWNQESWNQESSGIICDSANVKVNTLRLSKNGLSGSIPEEISVFSDLKTIEMTDGEIPGTLPSSLAELSLLEKLNLTTCDLVGTIPDFLYIHDRLTHLLLGDNSFTGTIPSSLGTAPKLEYFWVMNNNLKGTIPASVGQSVVLESIDLAGNYLTGTIPEFSPSSQLFYVNLDNNTLNGSIPSSIGNLNMLVALFLVNNTLEGQIPTELAQCTDLKAIIFERNNLTGDIGSIINMLPQSLMALDLTYNRLSGMIPTSIGKYTNLEFLDLGDNNLNGTIPTEIGLLINLEEFYLFSNQLTGTVPSMASLPLKRLNIADNNLTGSLEEFCSIVDIEAVDMLAANTCGQADEIACSCCTHCCYQDKDGCPRID